LELGGEFIEQEVSKLSEGGVRKMRGLLKIHLPEGGMVFSYVSGKKEGIVVHWNWLQS